MSQLSEGRLTVTLHVSCERTRTFRWEMRSCILNCWSTEEGAKLEPNLWILGDLCRLNSAVCQSHALLTEHPSTTVWLTHPVLQILKAPRRDTFIQKQRQITVGRWRTCRLHDTVTLPGCAGKCADLQGLVFEPNRGGRLSLPGASVDPMQQCPDSPTDAEKCQDTVDETMFKNSKLDGK